MKAFDATVKGAFSLANTLTKQLAQRNTRKKKASAKVTAVPLVPGIPAESVTANADMQTQLSDETKPEVLPTPRQTKSVPEQKPTPASSGVPFFAAKKTVSKVSYNQVSALSSDKERPSVEKTTMEDFITDTSAFDDVMNIVSELKQKTMVDNSSITELEAMEEPTDSTLGDVINMVSDMKSAVAEETQADLEVEKQKRLAKEIKNAENQRAAEAAERDRIARETEVAKEEMRKKEAARLEQERQMQEAKKAEDDRISKQALKEQQERLAREMKQAEQEKQALAEEEARLKDIEKKSKQEMMEKEAARVQRERQAVEAKKVEDARIAQAAVRAQQDRMKEEMDRTEKERKAAVAERERQYEEAKRVEQEILARQEKKKEEAERLAKDPFYKVKAASSVKEIKFAKDRGSPGEVKEKISPAEQLARFQYAKSEEKRLKLEAVEREALRRKAEESIRNEELRREKQKAERLSRDAAIKREQGRRAGADESPAKQAAVVAETERMARLEEDKLKVLREQQERNSKSESAARALLTARIQNDAKASQLKQREAAARVQEDLFQVDVRSRLDEQEKLQAAESIERKKRVEATSRSLLGARIQNDAKAKAIQHQEVTAKAQQEEQAQLQEERRARLEAEEAAHLEEQKLTEEKARLAAIAEKHAAKARAEADAAKEAQEEQEQLAEEQRQQEAALWREQIEREEVVREAERERQEKEKRVARDLEQERQEAVAEAAVAEAARAEAAKIEQQRVAAARQTRMISLEDFAKLPSLLETIDDANAPQYLLLKEFSRPKLPKDFPKIFANPMAVRPLSPEEVAEIEASKSTRSRRPVPKRVSSSVGLQERGVSGRRVERNVGEIPAREVAGKRVERNVKEIPVVPPEVGFQPRADSEEQTALPKKLRPLNPDGMM